MRHFTDEAEQVIQDAKVQAEKRRSCIITDVDILLALLSHSEAEPMLRTVFGPSMSANAAYSAVLKKTTESGNFASMSPNLSWDENAQRVLWEARIIAHPADVKCLLLGLIKTGGKAIEAIGETYDILPQGLNTLGFPLPAELVEGNQVLIRWMIRRDMPAVLAIEGASFGNTWTYKEFLACLRQRNCIGMVAENNDEVVGFIIYEMMKTRIHLISLAVTPGCQRNGVGNKMVEELKRKLSPNCRTRLVSEVRETNLPAQLFFRTNGFKAVSVLRNYYDDTLEDAYLMSYKYRPEACATGANRVEHLNGS